MSVISLRDWLDGDKCTRELNIEKLRQPSYVCMTCRDRRLLCRFCKEQHSVLKHQLCYLGMRRLSCEQKQDAAVSLSDHTRLGRFCWCDKEWKDGSNGSASSPEDNGSGSSDGQSVMWQCYACEDWFHVACIRAQLPWISPLDCCDGLFVCKECTLKFPISGCVAGSNPRLAVSLIVPDASNWMPACSCHDCSKAAKELDDFDGYVELNEEDDGEQNDDADEAVPDKAALLEAIDGYNELKKKLSEILRSVPPDHVVTCEDVQTIFSALK